MKSLLYIMFAGAGIFALSSCEKKDYPAGIQELEHHYYAIFVPNNNTTVTVQKNQSSILKFPVQFYSTFTRDYDAVAYYGIVTTGIANPALIDQDFNIVDKNGNIIQPVNDKYSITFPKAVQATDTIYVKLLNNPAPGTRKVEIQIQENKTDQYYVDIFSTAFRRPVEIK